MKYYLIAGEASGDLHASRLMRSLKEKDEEAVFRFFGGDLMAAEGGTLVKHYRELAYMGFIPVLMHLPTILKGMRQCKQDIREWHPDVVILVDYPGFNLGIAKYVKAIKICPVYYYISPKIWAWKEYRIKAIKRDVDELFSILPFEVEFFEQKHHYPMHYVGNPTAQEVREFLGEGWKVKGGGRILSAEKSADKDISFNPPPSSLHQNLIALLAGSRKQEIKDNLPAMIEAAAPYATEYQLVVAGAPAIDDAFYAPFIEGKPVTLVKNQTYKLLSQATAALVTSGTATLETALFNVPQVVCYKTPVPRLVRFAFNHIIKCKYISLVNLIADREVVQELLADRFSVENIRNELRRLLPGHDARTAMLFDYREVAKRLGDDVAPDNAAQLMVRYLRQ